MKDEELDLLIKTLADTYAEIPLAGDETVAFNVLDEVHLNENTHTRILVKLLQHPKICRSFLSCLGERFPQSGLREQVMASGGAEPKTRCFSEYVDARIRLNKDVSVLIENKVMDAVDQDAQVDRYVEAEENKNGGKGLTFVVYLTKDGARKVSNASFARTRELLGYKSVSEYGRFLAANYRDHIVPWLRNWVLPWAKENGKTMLEAGVAQYVDYLEGPTLLDCRAKKDATFERREAVKKIIKSKSLSFDDCVRLASRLAQIRYQRICAAVYDWRDESLFDALTANEKGEAVQRFYYAILGMALPEGENHLARAVDVAGEKDVAVFDFGAWQDTSLRQVGVWCADGLSKTSREKYVEWCAGVRSELHGLRQSDFRWNDCAWVRFSVDKLEDAHQILQAVLPLKNAAEPSWRSDPLHGGILKSLWLDEKDALKNPDLTAFLEDAGRAVVKVAPKVEVLDEIEKVKCGGLPVTETWNGGWAIQFIEGSVERRLVRRVDFYPRRGVEPTVEVMKEIIQLSARHPYRTYRWDGRTCFSFPVVEQTEAIELCNELNEIRKR